MERYDGTGHAGKNNNTIHKNKGKHFNFICHKQELQ